MSRTDTMVELDWRCRDNRMERIYKRRETIAPSASEVLSRGRPSTSEVLSRGRAVQFTRWLQMFVAIVTSKTDGAASGFIVNIIFRSDISQSMPRLQPGNSHFLFRIYRTTDIIGLH